MRAFVDARLLVTGTDEAGRDTVELAHDGLIRNWPRLQRWLEEEREALVVYRRLAQAASDWDRAGRDESNLLTGLRLKEAQAWARDHSDQLTALDQAFLSTSAAQRRRILRQLIGILLGQALILVILLSIENFVTRSSTFQRTIAPAWERVLSGVVALLMISYFALLGPYLWIVLKMLRQRRKMRQP